MVARSFWKARGCELTELALRNQTLVALTPTDVAPAQQELRGWCQAKILDLSRDLKEQRENFRHAITHKWKALPWKTQIAKTKKRMVYYTKIRKAVEAGYLVVPNFPIEVVAVRVDRHAPLHKRIGRWASDVNTAQPELLPPGQGRYVDEITFTDHDTEWEENKSLPDGGSYKPRRRTGNYDDDVDFPVVGVKPIIMQATTMAMQQRIFDRIGIANHSGSTSSRRARRADPIVVGQVIDPVNKGRWNEKAVTFFIAWWLDTSTL